jgi:hypothetical protein
LGEAARSFARRPCLEPALARFALPRDDLREGFPVAESSRAAVARDVERRTLRAAVEPPPALRCVALTPGCDVSTLFDQASVRARFAAERPTRAPIKLPSGSAARRRAGSPLDGAGGASAGAFLGVRRPLVNPARPKLRRTVRSVRWLA